ncbi:MAG: YggS family pyridoxal phosphate-dependent enzyme [Akkermansiaceae bacterium]|nr:YggS family pyridoxal phosphate-dependent enzyme [Akkermansiaceae bacterium]MCF7731100.1 YggS family pyridoxal phosphate-dependent enzyme [Akkermansiaceae bacterium]
MVEAVGRLGLVRARIRAACAASGREADAVELIAVSKTYPADAVREVFEAGQVVFGESRQQEAAPKIAVLPAAIRWHFIGRVQRNKVRKLLPAFEVIHALDSLRLAAAVNEVAAELGLFPKVFLQVNVAGEASKGGFEPAALDEAMEALLGLERLEIQGLMTIPPEGPDAETARPWFERLRTLRDGLELKHGVSLPGLSMGMSGDFEVAIAEGATHVRVGSAIFGTRLARVEGELGWKPI